MSLQAGGRAADELLASMVASVDEPLSTFEDTVDDAAPQGPSAQESKKVDIRLPGKGNLNPHGARPVY